MIEILFRAQTIEAKEWVYGYYTNMKSKDIRFLHFKAWNEWRKRNTNSGFHKFLVLIGVKRASPTFIIAKSLYGIDFVSAFKAGLAEGRKAIEVAHEQEQS